MNEPPSLSVVEAALPKVAVGLEKYCWIQEHLAGCDVSTNAEFQKRFVGFYRVRRGQDWRTAYFRLLQTHKTEGLSFSEALRQLVEKTGRFEASFASKLVATMDPNLPVIDSVVIENVGLRLPDRTAHDRFEKTVALYEQLANWFNRQLHNPTGAAAVQAFRSAYPNAPITDTKALDLVLWQIRTRGR